MNLRPLEPHSGKTVFTQHDKAELFACIFSRLEGFYLHVAQPFLPSFDTKSRGYSGAKMSQPKHKTAYPGVRYREHPSRRHGVSKDRYFFIRFKVNGKDKEEGVGWASSGMTAEKASRILAEIRENIRTGNGPHSLAECRAENEAARMEKNAKAEAEARQNVLFGKFFEEDYFPIAKTRKKSGSIVSEDALYRKWISPVLADVSLLGINYSHIEKIIKHMTDAGRSRATIKYALAVISQVWTYAKNKGIAEGDSPTKKFTIGKLDNERMRFLTEEEANRLVHALANHSLDLRDMALFSLCCGLRASEIFKLRWSDVDMGNGTIQLINTKSGRSRIAYFTPDIENLLLERLKKSPSRDELIFPTTNGKIRERISKTFRDVVKELGLNEGITNAKQKVVFHTLRHTFASWLAQRGEPLYAIQMLMGHSDFKMVQRYAHLSKDGLKNSVRVLNNIFTHNESEAKKASVIPFERGASK